MPSLDAASRADQVIVTDSNRKQAHHWRGSQDALGFVEGVDDGVRRGRRGRPPTARVPRPDDRRPDRRRTERADRGDGQSAYGEPTAYRPEDRAALAIDGDPTTAWQVGDRADPLGEYLRLELAEPTTVGALQIVQPQSGSSNRRITELDVRTEDGVRPRHARRHVVRHTPASRSTSGSPRRGSNWRSRRPMPANGPTTQVSARSGWPRFASTSWPRRPRCSASPLDPQVPEHDPDQHPHRAVAERPDRSGPRRPGAGPGPYLRVGRAAGLRPRGAGEAGPPSR